MSCSARLPVYVVFALAFFGTRASTVIWLLYVVGVVVAILVGFIFSRTVLKPDARAVFWSAGADRKFEARLRKGGFKVKVVPAKMNDGSRRPSYVLYIADRD